MTEPEPKYKMSDMTTDDGNFLINRFLGFGEHDTVYRYHEDWNWLMCVIKKISECRILINDSATPVIMKSGIVKRELLRIDILKTWQAVIEFIQWYNTQTPKA